MDIKVYEIGQLVRVLARFTDINEREFDPQFVFLTITDPAGGQVERHYEESGGDVFKDGVGRYHFDQLAVADGTWLFRWSSSGAEQAAKTGKFIVAPPE